MKSSSQVEATRLSELPIFKCLASPWSKHHQFESSPIHIFHLQWGHLQQWDVTAMQPQHGAWEFDRKKHKRLSYVKTFCWKRPTKIQKPTKMWKKHGPLLLGASWCETTSIFKCWNADYLQFQAAYFDPNVVRIHWSHVFKEAAVKTGSAENSNMEISQN